MVVSTSRIANSSPPRRAVTAVIRVGQLPEAVDQDHTVGQAGQRVVGGLVAQTLVQFVLLAATGKRNALPDQHNRDTPGYRKAERRTGLQPGPPRATDGAGEV